MIMPFLTFCSSCSQLFAKGRFTGLSSMCRLLTFHSYGVGALHNAPIRALPYIRIGIQKLSPLRSLSLKNPVSIYNTLEGFGQVVIEGF